MYVYIYICTYQCGTTIGCSHLDMVALSDSNFWGAPLRCTVVDTCRLIAVPANQKGLVGSLHNPPPELSIDPFPEQRNKSIFNIFNVTKYTKVVFKMTATVVHISIYFNVMWDPPLQTFQPSPIHHQLKLGANYTILRYPQIVCLWHWVSHMKFHLSIFPSNCCWLYPIFNHYSDYSPYIHCLVPLYQFLLVILCYMMLYYMIIWCWIPLLTISSHHSPSLTTNHYD